MLRLRHSARNFFAIPLPKDVDPAKCVAPLGNFFSPRSASTRRTRHAVPVGSRVAIGIGSRNPVNVPNPFGNARGFGGGGFRAELDEDTLRAIAELTQGEYFYAADVRELEKIYSNLGLHVTLKLEKLELTAYLSAFAALLLISALGLALWWGG